MYPLLNAALRKHDKRSLEPFLPYMKLLLSGLYRLPLVRARTYRGVKLELYKVREPFVIACPLSHTIDFAYDYTNPFCTWNAPNTGARTPGRTPQLMLKHTSESL